MSWSNNVNDLSDHPIPDHQTIDNDILAATNCSNLSDTLHCLRQVPFVALNNVFNSSVSGRVCTVHSSQNYNITDICLASSTCHRRRLHRTVLNNSTSTWPIPQSPSSHRQQYWWRHILWAHKYQQWHANSFLSDRIGYREFHVVDFRSPISRHSRNWNTRNLQSSTRYRSWAPI